MADVAVPDQVIKKKDRSQRALKPKDASAEASEANILAASAAKENHREALSQPQKKSKSKQQSAAASSQSWEKDLKEMQEKLQQLRLEKETAEEMLRVKDEEHGKLQLEFKRLQKLKEFKPTVALPISQSLPDEQENKGKKKKGSAEKTKKPSPAYTLWCKDKWNEVKKENPGAEFKDISNILGAKWKTVSAEERKPYEEKYQAEKEAYLQIIVKEKREKEAIKLFEDEQKQKTAMELLEQYLQFKQEAEKEETMKNKKKKKKEKDPLKPKHPMSAYFLFSQERRADLFTENKSTLEVAKITGEEWKNMTEEQRGPYEKMAKGNKEKYHDEMKAYMQKKDEEVRILKSEEEELKKIQKQEALQLLRKREKAENIIRKSKEEQQKKKQQQKEERNVDPNKPKKPASSFLLFSKETRKSIMQEKPGVNNSTVNALISVKWKELNEEERQAWNNKAAEAMEAYKKELEDYYKSAASTREKKK